MSLKTEGKLYYEGVKEDFASEMALAIDESVDKAHKVTLLRHNVILLCEKVTQR